MSAGNGSWVWNGTVEGVGPGPQYACLALLLIPISCILGNLLVILSVAIEKNLQVASPSLTTMTMVTMVMMMVQTTTNFLLVSLAAADLLVGALVMPFSVYLAVHNLEWYLGKLACNLFCVMDVAGSTSSIVHLVAISMDRFLSLPSLPSVTSLTRSFSSFFAVVRHTEYKTARHRRRVYVTILFTWIFSFLIALPLGKLGFTLFHVIP